jgi:hypothetical protein
VATDSLASLMGGGWLRRLGQDRRTELIVNALSQVFTCFEVWHPLAGHHDLFACFGVAPHTCRAFRQRKTTEPSNLDTLAISKRFHHLIDDGFNRKIGVIGHELWKARGQ